MKRTIFTPEPVQKEEVPVSSVPERTLPAPLPQGTDERFAAHDRIRLNPEPGHRARKFRIRELEF